MSLPVEESDGFKEGNAKELLAFYMAVCSSNIRASLEIALRLVFVLCALVVLNSGEVVDVVETGDAWNMSWSVVMPMVL